jgi:CheY-like chemotaxis protein
VSDFPPLNVLYAEDDENDAFFMRRSFARLNRLPELSIVSDGRAAIDFLSGVGEFGDRRVHPLPRLALLDIKMPAVSGLEVLSWIRQRPVFDRLAVAIFTSSTQESDIAFARTHEANAFLAKPSNVEDLRPLLQNLLAAAAAFSLAAAPRQARLDTPENLL